MILALCGTMEGETLIRLLLQHQYRVLATVTTDYGAKCLGQHDGVKVLEGKLTEASLKELLTREEIQAIVDVTHPYAANISTMAIECAKAFHIPYFRYERRGVDLNQETRVLEAVDFAEAARLADTIGEKAFLTIGSNHLKTFVEVMGADRLVARVLPFSSIIRTCEAHGFTPDNIIAMKGPFSEEMNRMMFVQYGAKVVVTKDSGRAGGTEEKLRAAKALGIPVIVVKRPPVNYGRVFDDLEGLVSELLKN